MSSPSSGSASGSDSDSDELAPPPPTRSDYAGYTALIRNLERRERSLGKRLLVRPEDIEGESEVDIDSQSSGLSSGLEDEYVPPENDNRQKRRSARVPRRPEPYRDGRKGKRTYTNETAKDDRWPLGLKNLEGDGPGFEEVIMDIAATQIVQDRLELPGAPPVAKPVRTGTDRRHSKMDNSRGDAEPLNDLIIPSTLVEETKLYLNKVLVELAGLRPMDIGKRRRRMKPMDWEGVLRAATLAGEPKVTREADEAIRLALITGSDEVSVHQHRLEAMAKYGHPKVVLDALLLPVLPEGPKIKRPHQTDAEMEQRAAKRAAKEEIRQIKAEAQAEKVRQREERRAQKKARQQARLHAIYLANKGSTTPGTEGS